MLCENMDTLKFCIVIVALGYYHALHDCIGVLLHDVSISFTVSARPISVHIDRAGLFVLHLGRTVELRV